MELADVVRRRRMVRHYTDAPVDAAVLDRILDTARRGPSAGFTQAQSFVVVTSEQVRHAIAGLCDEPEYVEAGFDPWISQAPVHVVPCTSAEAYRRRYAEPDKATSTAPDDWDVPFWWVDGGAALMLLLLAVADEGLAAGFLAAPATPLRDLLAIPAEQLPLGLVTIGHPAPDRRSSSLARGRRPLDDVVRRERW